MGFYNEKELTDFWASFFEINNKNFYTPIHHKSVLLNPHLKIKLIDEILLQMQQESIRHGRLRLYKGNRRYDDLAKKFLTSPTPAGLSPFAWMGKLAKSEKLAYIINDLQDWSEHFCHQTVIFLQGFYKNFGMPPGGVELVLFGGDYAGTPFGVHQGNEHAFLFHLGPGTKTFYMWSSEQFQELTGNLNEVFDYAWLLPYASQYVFEPGDVFFLPANWFHIGIQDSFSCTVAIALYQPSTSDVFRALLENNDVSNIKLPFLPIESRTNPIQTIIRKKVTKLLDHKIFEDFCEQLWLARISNGGIKRKDELPLEEPLPISPFVKLRAKLPYRIFWVVEKKKCQVRIYSRHRTLKLTFNNKLISLLHRLNAGQQLAMAEVIKVLEKEWNIEAILGVFRRLSQFGGLELVGPPCDLIDMDKIYVNKVNLSNWEKFVESFLTEIVFNLEIPKSGFIVELGTNRANNFEKFCNHFGVERCIGYDLHNNSKHPKVVEKDVRSLNKDDDIPIAFGWNDLSEWTTSPQSKMAGFKYIMRNLVEGGFYMDAAFVDNPFETLGIPGFKLTAKYGCIQLFQKESSRK